MAAVALSEGRTDTRLAALVATRIANAPDSAAAVDRLRRVLGSPVDRFTVVFPIEGIRNPNGLRAFQLREIRRSAPQWNASHTSGSDAALVAFCAGQDSQRTIVATDVDAFDFEQAATIAWQLGERAADQYAAEHRAYRIEVVPPLLVLRGSDGSISEQRSARKQIRYARPRLRRPDPRLEQSLRYAALARSERAPVVQVLHSWIALETLARGPAAPAGPYQLLMHDLAPALSIHAVRQSLAATWHVASRGGRRSPQSARWLELERWLGIRSSHRNLADLNRWVDVMRHTPAAGTTVPRPMGAEASLDEAAALLLELMSRIAGIPSM